MEKLGKIKSMIKEHHERKAIQAATAWSINHNMIMQTARIEAKGTKKRPLRQKTSCPQ